MERNTEVFKFFVGREKKGQAAFFAACAFVRQRGCRKTQMGFPISAGPG